MVAAAVSPWLLAIRLPTLVLDPLAAETAFVWMRRGEGGRNTDSLRQYRPVPLDAISRSLQDAVVIGEDNNFFTHGGIDYLAMAHAIGYPRQSFAWSSARDRDELFSVLPRAWSRRDKLRGASTISQQLAKNLYLSSSRNPLRKVKEAVTTYRLETALGKRRIMELYLDVAGWVMGSAPRPPARITRGRAHSEQAAALAGSLPSRSAQRLQAKPNAMEADLILRRMHGEWVEVPKWRQGRRRLHWRTRFHRGGSAAAVDSIPLIQADRCALWIAGDGEGQRSQFS